VVAAPPSITNAGHFPLPNYLAPEQIEGRTVDGRADIFAAGAMLYELIAGKRAFPGTNVVTVTYSIVHAEPPPLTAVVPGIDAAIEGIVDRALRKSADDRYEKAAGMCEDLARVRQIQDRSSADDDDEPIASMPRAEPARRSVEREAIARRREAEIAGHIEEARRVLERGAYEEALRVINDALVLDPLDPDAHALIREAEQALALRQAEERLQVERQLERQRPEEQRLRELEEGQRRAAEGARREAEARRQAEERQQAEYAWQRRIEEERTPREAEERNRLEAEAHRRADEAERRDAEERARTRVAAQEPPVHLGGRFPSPSCPVPLQRPVPHQRPCLRRPLADARRSRRESVRCCGAWRV
jgi:hypothetical protein